MKLTEYQKGYIAGWVAGVSGIIVGFLLVEKL
jgi:hypothetical protein